MSKYSSSVNNLLHIRQSGINKFIAVGKDRDNSILNLDDSNITAQFRVLDNIWTPQINLNNIEATYNSNVINIGSGNTIVQLNPYVGIGTNDPSVSFEINTTDSIKIPKGTTIQRPQNLTQDDKGFIRYNNELDQFEGFGAGNAWGTLGGVMDVDQDTYIKAETTSGTDNDELQFYTAGSEHMIIKADGKIGIGTSTPSVVLDVYDCNEHIFRVSNEKIEISRSIIPSNSNVDIGDPENQIRDMYVSDNSLWIGDKHKISQTDGKLKFRKRKTSTVPTVILELPAYQGLNTAQIVQSISTHFNDVSLTNINNITLKHWLAIYKYQKGPDSEYASIQEIFRDDYDDYSEETAADSWLLTKTNDIYLGTDYGKIGIGTDNPNVSLDISSRTDALKLPKGNNLTRTSIGAVDESDRGLIRYNTELDQFEGFGAGNAWGSLGGVIDVDQDTYIKAETNAGANNDELQFFTFANERMIIKKDGKIGINVSDPTHQMHIKGTTRIEGDLIVNGTQHIIDIDTSTTEQIIITNDGTGPALIVNQIGNQAIIDIQDDSNSILFIEDGGNIGIKTINPTVSFEINTTDSIKIPKGTTIQRPQNLTQDDKGFIRYNNELDQFEGFGAGNAWGTLGGVMDVNQDTYIKAETNAGANNDELQFFTFGVENMIIKKDGKVGIGVNSPDETLHINGNIKIIGNIVCDSLDTRFSNLQELLTITPGAITNDQLATLVQPNLVSAKAVNIDSTITGGLDNSTDNLKIKLQGVTNNHILNNTIDLTEKVINNLPVINGGTGANNTTDARTNLGVEIGTNVQAYTNRLQSMSDLVSMSKIPIFSGLITSYIDFIDDEYMSCNSATAIPSQRSIKKYVDDLVNSLNVVVYTLHASNLNSNVDSLPPEASATLSLDADYSIVGAEGTEQYTTFIGDMTSELAATIGVEEDNIVITDVSEGSLVVDFVVKPSILNINFNPSQSIVAFKEIIENPQTNHTNNKFLSQGTVAVPPEVVAQALDPSKIFIILENDKDKVIGIDKYFKGEFITYNLITNPYDNVIINTSVPSISVKGEFRDAIYNVVINASKGSINKDLIFNITEPAPFPPTSKNTVKIVLSDSKKQINVLDKFKGSYLEIFEVYQNPFNNVTLIDSSNMIYEVQGAFRDASYDIVFKATQNGGNNLSAYWTLSVKELPIIPTKLLPDIDSLFIARNQTITYDLRFVFIGTGLQYGFNVNPYPNNIYISNSILYITENQRGITYPIEVFGKNISQKLTWKITLNEDLPAAPVVILENASNFITTDILNYDLSTLFSGLNLTYDIEYYYNIGSTIYPPIDAFFIQSKPWARYHSKNWNKYLNRIVDTSGFNRPSIELLSGNVISYDSYISGDNTTSLKIPMPNTLKWTACFAVKYNGIHKGTIVSGHNTILGHWNGYRGFIQIGGKLLTKIESIGNVEDWLILCVKTNGISPNNVRLNGTGIGIQNNEIALDYLYINKDLNSDWIFGDFMIWDYELSDSKTLGVSELFMNHISGTTNALKNDIQPVDLHSVYNNYNFESNIVTISGNNRGTNYDIYVIALNTSASVKWKLEVKESSNMLLTPVKNISLTKGAYEYNIKYLFNNTGPYVPHLSINNENFYNITDNVLTFYPNYRDMVYGLILDCQNEQFIFNIKEETGLPPRGFNDSFYLIDNRLIETVNVITNGSHSNNTVIMNDNKELYFAESMVCSLLLIDDIKYYYISNIILNGIYQVKCEANDIKLLDDNSIIKYSSSTNGININTDIVNNLLSNVFNANSSKFILKYTPYENVKIINDLTDVVTSINVEPTFSIGSSVNYTYTSDSNFNVNFTESFSNCELLLIDNTKYYYNSNIVLNGSQDFTLSSSNVSILGTVYNTSSTSNLIDYTVVNNLITSRFISDKLLESNVSDTTGTIDTTNMLVWYKFDDDLLDTIGNTTITNGITTNLQNTVSRIPPEKYFDINTNQLNINSSLSLGSFNAFTVSIWVYITSNSNHKPILYFQETGAAVNTKNYFGMYVSYNSQTLKFDWQYNGLYEQNIPNINLALNSWSNIVIVYNKILNKIELYINNVLVNTDLSRTGWIQNVVYSNILLGNWVSGFPTVTSFPGYIDDFRVYNKALTAQEISDIYNNTEPIITTYQSDYIPIQRVFLKYTPVSKAVSPSIVETSYVHPVNVNPILINNDQYYAEIKNTNTIASVSVEELVPDNTLVLHYKFETGRELLDTTGNYPLTSAGSVSFTNSIAYFPNQNSHDYLRIGGNFNPYTIWKDNGISFSIWFKGMQDITDDWSWIMSFADLIWMYSGRKGPEVRYYINGGWTNPLPHIFDNTWHHVVWSIDRDGNWSWVIDGIKLNVVYNKVIPDVDYSICLLGAKSIDNVDNDFGGYIGEFRVYNRVLTVEEAITVMEYSTAYSTQGDTDLVDATSTPNTNLIPLMNTIYFPETYTNCEVLIIGSTKYFKYQYVILNNFATITINDDNTNISVNNTIYGLSTGTVINNDLTTILNTVYNIPSHNNIPKVLIKYTVGLKNKITSIEFNDQYYPNVLDYATNLQINNNNITYNENNLKISSNVVLDFDNYFTETISATNEYGTTPLNYNFIKLGYNELVVPNLYTVSMNIYITNTMDIVNIDLREIEKGDNYKLIYNPYSFDKNTFLIDYTLTFTTNSRGIYDILVSIDNKLYVLRVHETESSIDDNVYNIG